MAASLQIDKVRGGLHVAAEMSWLRKLSAILLLALWLPVTSHCALEMAGVIPSSVCCSDGDEHAHHDSCDEVENNLFKQASETSLVKAPALACACFIAELVALPAADSDKAPESFFERAPDWFAERHFEHRTALPARAPSVIA
jgi:hypothetical protein